MTSGREWAAARGRRPDSFQGRTVLWCWTQGVEPSRDSFVPSALPPDVFRRLPRGVAGLLATYRDESSAWDALSTALEAR